MSTEAQIVVLPAGGTTLEIQTVQIPDPGPFEVLVRQRATGVCHSQLGHIAAADPAQPLVLGHESYGTVVAVGDQVTHVVPGQDVFITWISRNAARKPNGVTIPFPDGSAATTRNVFTWGTYALADEQYVVAAPSDLPPDVASIIGCAVMTGAGAVLNSSPVAQGDTVAVWGVGGVGLVSVAAAKISGASRIVAVDIDERKLDFSRHFGADDVVNALTADAVSEIRRLAPRTDGVEGVDHSYDCTGRADNLAKSLAVVRPGVPGRNQGGSLVLVSVIRGSLEIPGMEMLNGQKHITGCLGGSGVPERDFPVYVDWYRSGRLDLDALVTNRYTLEQVNDAVADLRGGKILGRAVIEF